MMKMYVKPSIEVIELQLKEDIAAVPTTVYKGSKSDWSKNDNHSLKATDTGIELSNKMQSQYGITISAG